MLASWGKRYYPPPKTDASCQLCQDFYISRRDIRHRFGISLGIPLGPLRKSASSGCPSCSVLLGALRLEVIKLPGTLVGVTIVSDHYQSPLPPLTVQLETGDTSKADDAFSIEIFTEAGLLSCWPEIGHARNITEDATRRQCVRLMKSWVHDCLSDHALCKAHAATLLPDRVLDVRPGREPVLHLNTKGDTGVYAALSHSWGGKVKLMLLKENIDDLRQGIPLTRFPTTFKDAIEVCRLLNIPYLWIDSLCIIQDSEGDWDIQGSKMGDIYSRCLLAIAADGAQTSNHGFLRRQVSVAKVPVPLDAKLRALGPAEVYVFAREKKQEDADTFKHHKSSKMSRSRLSSRGWILQESLLAPRILHFTAEEITWECATLSRCECQVPAHSFATSDLPLRMSLQAPLHHKAHWHQLVEEFSSRDLTYPSDRLPAVSGLAARMQPADPRVTYCAGLWSDSLPASLMWFQSPSGAGVAVAARVSARVDPKVAPTWSWASITGRVAFMIGSEEPSNLDDVQVTCLPLGKNKYGNLRSAELTARAVVHKRPAYLRTCNDKSFCHVRRYDHREDFQSEIALDVDESPGAEVCEGDNLYFVDPWRGAGMRSYLVLRKVRGAEPETYERVGLCIAEAINFDSKDSNRKRITII